MFVSSNLNVQPAITITLDRCLINPVNTSSDYDMKIVPGKAGSNGKICGSDDSTPPSLIFTPKDSSKVGTFSGVDANGQGKVSFNGISYTADVASIIPATGNSGNVSTATLTSRANIVMTSDAGNDTADSSTNNTVSYEDNHMGHVSSDDHESEVADPASWTLAMSDETANAKGSQSDRIIVFPYHGDQGLFTSDISNADQYTGSKSSSYNGSYTVGSVTLGDDATSHGTVLCYTTKAKPTLDPSSYSGSCSSSGSTGDWIAVDADHPVPANATGLRVITPQTSDSAASATIHVTLNPTDNKDTDAYVMWMSKDLTEGTSSPDQPWPDDVQVVSSEFGGHVWWDDNSDGSINNDEPLISGIRVDLYTADAKGQPTGDVIASTSTDDRGAYSFKGLHSGQYVTVMYKGSKIPDTVTTYYHEKKKVTQTYSYQSKFKSAASTQSTVVNLAKDKRNDHELSPSNVDFGFNKPQPKVTLDKSETKITNNDDGTATAKWTVTVKNTGNTAISDGVLTDRTSSDVYNLKTDMSTRVQSIHKMLDGINYLATVSDGYPYQISDGRSNITMNKIAGIDEPNLFDGKYLYSYSTDKYGRLWYFDTITNTATRLDTTTTFTQFSGLDVFSGTARAAIVGDDGRVYALYKGTITGSYATNDNVKFSAVAIKGNTYANSYYLSDMNGRLWKLTNLFSENSYTLSMVTGPAASANFTGLQGLNIYSNIGYAPDANGRLWLISTIDANSKQISSADDGDFSLSDTQNYNNDYILFANSNGKLYRIKNNALVAVDTSLTFTSLNSHTVSDLSTSTVSALSDDGYFYSISPNSSSVSIKKIDTGSSTFSNRKLPISRYYLYIKSTDGQSWNITDRAAQKVSTLVNFDTYGKEYIPILSVSGIVFTDSDHTTLGITDYNGVINTNKTYSMDIYNMSPISTSVDGSTTKRSYTMPYLAPGNTMVVNMQGTIRRPGIGSDSKVIVNQAFFDSSETPISGLQTDGKSVPDGPVTPSLEDAKNHPKGIPGNASCNTDDTSQDPEDSCDQVSGIITPQDAVLGSLSGVVWHDANGNGLREDDEQYASKALVSLYKNNVLVGERITNSDGSYIFDDLTPGSDYQVVIDKTNIQPLTSGKSLGWTTESSSSNISDERDSNVNDLGQTVATISVTAGKRTDHVDGGLIESTTGISVIKGSVKESDGQEPNPVTIPLRQGSYQTTTVTAVITNTGEDALRNISVTDNTIKGTPVSNWRWSYNGSSGYITNMGSIVLPAGASITLTGSLSLANQNDFHKDDMLVSGVGVTTENMVNDHDPYSAKPETLNPSLTVIKGSTGDASQDEGDNQNPQIALQDGSYPDQKVYVSIRNTGNDVLKNINVSDLTTSGDDDVRDWTYMYNSSSYTADTLNSIYLYPGQVITAVGTLSLTSHHQHKDTYSASGVGSMSGTLVSDDDPFTITPLTPDPSMTVTKNDPGDDTHIVSSGDNTVNFKAVNTSEDQLTNLVFKDTTDKGSTAKGWSFKHIGSDGSTIIADNLTTETISSVVLKPGERLTGTATVTMTSSDEHRDTAALTATGVISQKTISSSDPTTLITKTFEFTKTNDEGSDLTGSKFALWKADDGTDTTAIIGKDGATGWSKVAETTSNPKVVFSGLGTGTYRLIEVQAPTGYLTPSGQWNIVITSTNTTITGIANQGSMPNAFKKNDDGSYSLSNTAISTLPSSGSIGIIAMMIIGTLMIGGSVIVFRKRTSSVTS
jgi:LPXTG-motif cell wall-anchored protein